jgi:hypothetical protein
MDTTNGHGYARHLEDELKLQRICGPYLDVQEEDETFYEALYLLQLKAFYFSVSKTYRAFYQAVLKWVNLFELHPQMKQVEQLQYHRRLACLSEAALLQNQFPDLQMTSERLWDAAGRFYSLLCQLNLALGGALSGEGLWRSEDGCPIPVTPASF